MVRVSVKLHRGTVAQFGMLCLPTQQDYALWRKDPFNFYGSTEPTTVLI